MQNRCPSHSMLELVLPVGQVVCVTKTASKVRQLTSFTDVSWKTFKEATALRDDDIARAMTTKWESGPFGGYHRVCYQMYTGKDHLQRVLKKRKLEPPLEVEEDSEEEIFLTRSSISQTNIKQCIICQGDKTDSKDRRRKEKLSSCQTFAACESLLKAAQTKGDQRLRVALEGQDPIALEVCYHRTCFRYYIKVNEAGEEQTTISETQIYEDAFEELKIEIDTKLFKCLEVFKMATLRERYVELLSVRGIENSEYRTEKLKARIQRCFGDRVDFWHPRYRSETELIYNNEVPKGQVVESGVNLSFEEDISMDGSADDGSTDINHIYHAAKAVRMALLSQDSKTTWPPTAATLNECNIQLPSVVFNLLAWILSDNTDGSPDENVTVTDPVVRRLILSIGQDLAYNISKGRHKTPKHVALPMTVKNLTGSKEVISLLNRFGHGISYEQLLSVETAMAEKQIAAEEGGVVLPSNVQPNVFSLFAWDNIDILEETLSGRGTTHCTNGIVVQRQVAWCEPPPLQTQERRTRRRALPPVANQVRYFVLIL